MKAGLMEIANIFVVNKADRPNADDFVKNLRLLAHVKGTPVIKTIATQQQGIAALIDALDAQQEQIHGNLQRKALLLTEKAWQIIRHRRMQDVDKQVLLRTIQEQMEDPQFSIYRTVQQYVRPV